MLYLVVTIKVKEENRMNIEEQKNFKQPPQSYWMINRFF